MAESGFPGQHTTTTTVTSNTTVQTNLRYDPSYFRTLPGMLKIGQIIINLLGFICIEASGFPFHSRGAWFNTVAMGGFWITGFLLAFYIFHVVEKFFRIPWLKIEFVYCALWTVFYLTAACLAVTLGNEAYVVAGLFGFVALAAYAFDAFLKYKAVKSGELAQGDRVISKQTTTVSSPAY